MIDFLIAIEMNPSKAVAYVNLGQIFLKHLKDYKMAHECFTKCISYDPNQLKAYLSRADLFQKMYMAGVPLYVIFDDKKDTHSGNNHRLNPYYERAIRDYSKCIHIRYPIAS